MHLDDLRLYFFEGIPCFTDVKREGELLSTDRYIRLRYARARWRETHRGRDPRYLVCLADVALASSEMQPCPLCQNERPRVLDALVCYCTRYN